VEYRGYIDDATYETLLGTCTVFALPSVGTEGLGLQVLDALQRGVPVLASRRGAYPEVLGEAGVYVDPEDVSSIAAGLERLLVEQPLRENLQQQGPRQARSYSWKRSVDTFLEVLRGILAPSA
jgi:glycosyltransferase involved in cell wall biosynthesis